MEDNERDRFAYGYDAGIIVDGVVHIDSNGRCTIVDDEDASFCPNDALKSFDGKKIRITMISIEAIDDMAKMYEAAEAAMKSNA